MQLAEGLRYEGQRVHAFVMNYDCVVMAYECTNHLFKILLFNYGKGQKKSNRTFQDSSFSIPYSW